MNTNSRIQRTFGIFALAAILLPTQAMAVAPAIAIPAAGAVGGGAVIAITLEVLLAIGAGILIAYLVYQIGKLLGKGLSWLGSKIARWWRRPPPPQPTRCILSLSVNVPMVGTECHYTCTRGGVPVGGMNFVLGRYNQATGQSLESCPRYVSIP